MFGTSYRTNYIYTTSVNNLTKFELDNLMFTSSDMKYYLSGGANNLNSSQSLGGAPSNTNVTTSNLFSKVSQSGDIYRCIYIFNEGSSTLQNVIVSLDHDELLVDMYIGISKSIAVQQLLVSGNPFGGTFTLKYTTNVEGIPVTQETDPIEFTPTPSDMVVNIQNALNSLSLLSEVTATAEFQNNFWVYKITFGGVNAYKAHQTMLVGSNNLLGSSPAISVSAPTLGQPINGIAVDIGFENQAPSGVTFGEEVSVGNLSPLDGFALWILQSAPSGISASPSRTDSMTIIFSMQVDE